MFIVVESRTIFIRLLMKYFVIAKMMLSLSGTKMAVLLVTYVTCVK